MKKITFLFTFLFVTTLLQAQFTVEDYDGAPILDGDFRTFNTTSQAEATLYFWINNDTTEDILVKIKNVSITNSDGTAFQFCFGTLCIFDIVEGQTYPVSGIPETIPAGGTNPQFDKFFNENLGDGTNYPIDYVWKFFQVDGAGNELPGSITYTYRFDPTLGTSDLESIVNAKVINTYVDNELFLTLQEDVQLDIFNLQGKLVSSTGLSIGNHSLNMATLKTGMYIALLTNATGNKATAKFIKK